MINEFIQNPITVYKEDLGSVFPRSGSTPESSIGTYTFLFPFFI